MRNSLLGQILESA